MNGKAMFPLWMLVVVGLSAVGCASGQATVSPPATKVVVVHEGPAHDHGIVVKKKPPKPKRERYGKRPSRRHVWVPGHWEWRRDRYVWVRGHWAVPPRPGAVWVAAHWKKRGDGWVFVAGYWR